MELCLPILFRERMARARYLFATLGRTLGLCRGFTLGANSVGGRKCSMPWKFEGDMDEAEAGPHKEAGADDALCCWPR